MNNNEFENIDDIVDKIKGDNTTSLIPIESPDITDDTVNSYIYQKSTELVESSLAAINTIRDSVLQGIDPDEINALTSLIAATNKALDTLNKINLQNKKVKSTEKMKTLEIEARKEMMSKRIPATTNVLIATRDEIMKTLSSSKQKTIQVED